MSAPIEFWFDFSSPYAYFAANSVESRLSRFGRTILWRPFLLGAAFKITGMGSLTHTPMRGDYAKRDWKRIADSMSLPFSLPNHHPYRSQNSARTYYWLEENAPESATLFAKRAFAAHFEQGKDLTEKGAVLSLLPEAPATLGNWLDSADAKAVLKSKTDEAISKGVFGSPFFIVDGEPFWGWDRLAFVERLLEGK